MVTFIIMLFAFPLGLLMILQEKRDYKKYKKIFNDFLDDIKAEKRLDDKKKIAKLRSMLEYNGYYILNVNTHGIKAEKKLFSLGWFLIFFSFFYIGALIYITYYFKFKKPHIVNFSL